MVPGQAGRLSGGPGSVLISPTWRERERLGSLDAGSPRSLGNPGGPDASQMQPDTLGRRGVREVYCFTATRVSVFHLLFHP